MNKLALRGDCTLEFEVACIDLTPIEEGETRAEIASIGLWTDISVRLLRIPSLEEITREMIGGEIIPRSILIAKFEGVNYLLCSLGDGSLIYYLFTPQGTLVDRRKVKNSLSLFLLVHLFQTFLIISVLRVFPRQNMHSKFDFS